MQRVPRDVNSWLNTEDMRNIIKSVTPPFLVQWYHQIASHGQRSAEQDAFMFGAKSWADALNSATEYDHPALIERVRYAIQKVRSGEAVYERDSVLFDSIQYSWPLLAALLKIAAENEGVLNIIDFGGALGSTYYQNRHFLKGLRTIRWNIVEQAAFVDIGKKEFEDEQIKFFYSIDECLLHTQPKPSVILLSGVLQCVERPYEVLKHTIDNNFSYIIVDRLAFSDRAADVMSVQVVPEYMYKASFPSWFFNEAKFLQYLEGKYHLLADFDSYCDPTMWIDGHKLYWKGFIFSKQ